MDLVVVVKNDEIEMKSEKAVCQLKRKRETDEEETHSISPFDKNCERFDFFSAFDPHDDSSFDDILSLPLDSFSTFTSSADSDVPSAEAEAEAEEEEDAEIEANEIARKRENNRIYAQKSRLRKKICIETLRKTVKSLQSENDHLKALLNFYGIYYQGLPPLQL